MANGTVVAILGFNFYGGPNVPPGLTNVVAVASGDTHNLVLVGNSPPLLHSSLVNPTWSTNGFSVSVPTQNGQVYRLEYKNSLSDSDWMGLPLVHWQWRIANANGSHCDRHSAILPCPAMVALGQDSASKTKHP